MECAGAHAGRAVTVRPAAGTARTGRAARLRRRSRQIAPTAPDPRLRLRV